MSAEVTEDVIRDTIQTHWLMWKRDLAQSINYQLLETMAILG